MVKYARMGFGKDPYECKKDWADDCFVQCGENGMVLRKGAMKETFLSGDPMKKMRENAKHPETYFTAFFEVFPRNPDTFIRGEGSTVEEAEEKAWAKFEKYQGCQEHEFEKRGYTNGAGFCKHCNMFKSEAFEAEPLSPEQQARIEKLKNELEGEK